MLHVSGVKPEPEVILEAATVLERGGLVAFPTETVYGLGARGLHEQDVRKIFAAKQRPAGHPLILHVEDEAMAKGLASEWPEVASRLARAFWPGPLTLVVARDPRVPDVVTGGLDTVALRAPRHPVALALIAAAREPLAAPSANAHTHVSPTRASHVVQSLGEAVDLVLDAGPTEHGIESTVVDVAHGSPRVLRAGAASLETLRALVSEMAYAPLTAQGDAPRASPGLATKHYAPRARVVLAEPGEVVAEAARRGPRAGAIVWSEPERTALDAALRDETLELAFHASLPSDALGYAKRLFAAFYEADANAVEVLVVERVPDEPAWWAVADRLRRAAK